MSALNKLISKLMGIVEDKQLKENPYTQSQARKDYLAQEKKYGVDTEETSDPESPYYISQGRKDARAKKLKDKYGEYYHPRLSPFAMQGRKEAVEKYGDAVTLLDPDEVAMQSQIKELEDKIKKDEEAQKEMFNRRQKRPSELQQRDLKLAEISKDNNEINPYIGSQADIDRRDFLRKKEEALRTQEMSKEERERYWKTQEALKHPKGLAAGIEEQIKREEIKKNNERILQQAAERAAKFEKEEKEKKNYQIKKRIQELEDKKIKFGLTSEQQEELDKLNLGYY